MTLSRRRVVGIFVRLKWRLVVNGLRRRLRSTWARIGFAMNLLFALGAAALGVAMAVALRTYWGDSDGRRVLVIVTTGIVIGWWFGPVLSGGVDETIDPARLALLPLGRREIRTGQIAAGFVGIAPLMVVTWVVGIVVGSVRSWASAPLIVLDAIVVLLASIIGSRSLSTSLARLSRSRRGGDLAALIAVVGGAVVFAGVQLLRFLQPEDYDRVAGVLRWTPPGMGGDAFWLAGHGQPLAALWRIAVLALLTVVAGWWWSHQLDRLLVEPPRTGGDALRTTSGDLAIFRGVRRRLPRTPGGAAVARELIYMARSPGRRAALLAGSLLGMVYVGFMLAQGGASKIVVLGAPLAALFALQYASNQLGVDPGPFWLEVVGGGQPRARWAGRQLLGIVSLTVPVFLGSVFLAAITGGWIEMGVVLIVMAGAAWAMVGIGSVISASLVTPIPDSGNPFGGRQAMSGTGCSAAMVGMLYLLVVVILVVPAEFALRWAWRYQSPWVALLIGAGAFVLNLTIWRVSTSFAVRDLPRRELDVLGRLDQRLNV